MDHRNNLFDSHKHTNENDFISKKFKNKHRNYKYMSTKNSKSKRYKYSSNTTKFLDGLEIYCDDNKSTKLTIRSTNINFKKYSKRTMRHNRKKFLKKQKKQSNKLNNHTSRYNKGIIDSKKIKLHGYSDNPIFTNEYNQIYDNLKVGDEMFDDIVRGHWGYKRRSPWWNHEFLVTYRISDLRFYHKLDAKTEFGENLGIKVQFSFLFCCDTKQKQLGDIDITLYQISCKFYQCTGSQQNGKKTRQQDWKLLHTVIIIVQEDSESDICIYGIRYKFEYFDSIDYLRTHLTCVCYLIWCHLCYKLKLDKNVSSINTLIPTFYQSSKLRCSYDYNYNYSYTCKDGYSDNKKRAHRNKNKHKQAEIVPQSDYDSIYNILHQNVGYIPNEIINIIRSYLSYNGYQIVVFDTLFECGRKGDFVSIFKKLNSIDKENIIETDFCTLSTKSLNLGINYFLFFGVENLIKKIDICDKCGQIQNVFKYRQTLSKQNDMWPWCQLACYCRYDL